MANHKSALKRARQNVKRRERNRTARARMKTIVKEARVLLEEDGPREKLDSGLRVAEKEIRKAASAGLIHKKNASRKVSRLAKARDRLKTAATATA